jgi:hypothetical protein
LRGPSAATRGFANGRGKLHIPSMYKRESSVQRWRVSMIRGAKNQVVGIVLASDKEAPSRRPSSKTRSRTSTGSAASWRGRRTISRASCLSQRAAKNGTQWDVMCGELRIAHVGKNVLSITACRAVTWTWTIYVDTAPEGFERHGVEGRPAPPEDSDLLPWRGTPAGSPTTAQRPQLIISRHRRCATRFRPSTCCNPATLPPPVD